MGILVKDQKEGIDCYHAGTICFGATMVLDNFSIVYNLLLDTLQCFTVHIQTQVHCVAAGFLKTPMDEARCV